MTTNGWGSSFAQGGLMGMIDGTVRMFPYSMPNTGVYNSSSLGCS